MSENTAKTLCKLAEAMRDEQYMLPLGAIDYVKKAANEIERLQHMVARSGEANQILRHENESLRAQEAERKAELDNIHNTILPRLTEEIRKLQEERDRYHEVMEAAALAIRDNLKAWQYKDETVLHAALLRIDSALKGASK